MANHLLVGEHVPHAVARGEHEEVLRLQLAHLVRGRGQGQG